MKVLGIIPARGGSKGIPNKNLRELAGKTLLGYAAEAANAAGIFDRLVLSTDSQAIADLGRRLGLDVPFMRPANLATDDSPMLAVLQHAVTQLEEKGWKADIIVLLQATSPLRRAESIVEAVNLLKNGNYDSVVSVVEIPDLYSPQKAMRIENGRLEFWSPDGQMITRRQQVEAAYAREGTVYTCWRNVLIEKGSLYGDKCLPLVVSLEESLSLDTIDDWSRAEAILLAKQSQAVESR
ncbi:MAG: acylneuraminate cytidylyltransferase family protein [Sideroxyarcus sp.]|nr:acylneuraminate cytidylyltransferase family protein [Sideroxyarcus sp.]